MIREEAEEDKGKGDPLEWCTTSPRPRGTPARK